MGAPVTTTEIVILLFIVDILIHLAVSIAVGVYLHSKAKSASVEIGSNIMGMVPAISTALAENVADKVVEKLDAREPVYLGGPGFWQDAESIVG